MNGISENLLGAMEAAYDAVPAYRAVTNAVNQAGTAAILRDTSLEARMPLSFSIDIEAGKVTNQKASGRCWMFAALNTMRVRVMKKYNLEDMELSQNYLLFYDKLEKSNYFLETVLDTLEEETSGRMISWLMLDPVGDGGQWDMLANLVRKYGVVPKEAMPETFVSSATREINGWLKKKLRGYACTLRRMHAEGAGREALEAEKEKELTVIYRMLVTAFGRPPHRFTWETRSKDREFIRVADITPQRFFEEVVEFPLEDYVSLINAPTADKPYGRSYTIRYLGNVADGHIVRHLNLPAEELKRLAIAQLSDGEVVWFGCDVGQFLDRDLGIMDVAGVRADLLFDTDFSMTKAERLDYGESLMTHAMVFTGVNLDGEGKPDRWKVENSWGDERGRKGWYVMSDDWFSEYLYQVVVNKKYLSAEQLAAYEAEPAVLEPWDPMGSLAGRTDER